MEAGVMCRHFDRCVAGLHRNPVWDRTAGSIWRYAAPLQLPLAAHRAKAIKLQAW